MPISEEKRLQYLESAYKELCTSYRAIDDFRQKLLALLPLASASGIYLLAGGVNSATPMSAKVMAACGIFGFIATLGLLIFEVYGIRRCTHLIALGASIETQLGIAGQFTHRPAGLRGVDHARKTFSRLINEPLASGIVYPATMAGWAFLACSAFSPIAWVAPAFAAAAVFGVGFGALLRFNIWLADTDYPDKLASLPNQTLPNGDNNTTAIPLSATNEGNPCA